MFNPQRILRATTFGLLLCLFLPICESLAHGQADFMLSATPLQPSSVDPGVSALSTISVQPLNAVSGPTVDLSCSVLPQQTDGPTCSLPTSVSAPANPTLTVSTSSAAPQPYTVTVTGTSGVNTHTVTLNLTVLAVTPDYTLNVTTAISPATVAAGSGATAVITLSPINNYVGNVTLICSSISPAAVPSPICSFSPATVSVSGTAVGASTLTITTTGSAPPTTKNLRTPRIFYALFLAVPGLALIGLGSAAWGSAAWHSARPCHRRLLSWLLLMGIASAILLVPGCGRPNYTGTSTTTTSGTTPKNTYTFTLTGVDQSGLGPSNSGNTAATTITLSVSD